MNTVFSYPCAINWVYVISGCAQTRLFFVDEVVFSYDRSTEHDVDAAVDDLGEQGIECLIRKLS